MTSKYHHIFTAHSILCEFKLEGVSEGTQRRLTENPKNTQNFQSDKSWTMIWEL